MPLLALLALTACRTEITTTTHPVPAVITVVSASDDQTGIVAQQLALPVAVHVLDQFGAPLPGTVVQWDPVGGSGSVDSTISTTNSSGEATTHWTLGPTAGLDSLHVQTSNGFQIYVIASAIPGPTAILLRTSGDSQTVNTGAAAQPLVVTATDRFGNPTPGATAHWSASAGGVLSASTSTTDASGVTQVVFTAGSTPGTYTVTASVGAASATFTIVAK